jgi:hypothetical protein
MPCSRRPDIPYVSVVERSHDRKLTANGNVSATWVAQQSCPTSCPLLKNGCYAEVNKPGLHTHRMNKKVAARKKSKTAIRKMLVDLEVAGIRKLTGKRKLRVHVVGDAPTAAAATAIGTAMLAHQAKQGKVAWTYTHAWRDVPVQAWKGANVLASCNNVTEVASARAAGYGTSVIVPPHPTNKIYQFGGEQIVPCPAQFKHNGKRVVTCEDCTLCMRPTFLRKRRLSVGFQPDGGTQKKVLAMLQEVR